MSSSTSPRARVRDVLPSLFLGFYQPGPLNSITDVPGLLVSTQSICRPPGHDRSRPASVINTGVTVIVPRKNWFHEACYAAVSSFNRAGEMTGSHWINESGLLNSPIVITNTFSVGSAYNGVYQCAMQEYADKKTGLADWFISPVVAETCDGILNDVGAMAVTPEMIVHGIDNASSERVREGNTGGGTGMTALGYKAGTGSLSRIVKAVVEGQHHQYTVAALVQANYGTQFELRFGPVPVGRLIVEEDWEDSSDPPIWVKRLNERKQKKEGSIIVVLATGAPLNPTQLGRLVKRATVGLVRTGGTGGSSSGDIFVAFSTTNKIPKDAGYPADVSPRDMSSTTIVNRGISHSRCQH